MSLTLWFVGSAFVGLGWWGDGSGFWDGRGYLTNLFSSLTAAAFGIPLALVVLQQIATAQAEIAEMRAAKRYLITTCQRLQNVISLAVCDTAMTDIRNLHQELSRASGRYRELDSIGGEEFEEGVRESAPYVIDLLSRTALVLNPAVAVLTRDAEELWTHLTQEVRPRVLLTGAVWPVSAAESALTSRHIEGLRSSALKLQEIRIGHLHPDPLPPPGAPWRDELLTMHGLFQAIEGVVLALTVIIDRISSRD